MNFFSKEEQRVKFPRALDEISYSVGLGCINFLLSFDISQYLSILDRRRPRIVDVLDLNFLKTGYKTRVKSFGDIVNLYLYLFYSIFLT